MDLSILSEECQGCEHKDDCNEKRMVACLAINSSTSIASESANATVQSANTIEINIPNTMSDMSVEGLHKQISNTINKHIQCSFNNKL